MGGEGDQSIVCLFHSQLTHREILERKDRSWESRQKTPGLLSLRLSLFPAAGLLAVSYKPQLKGSLFQASFPPLLLFYDCGCTSERGNRSSCPPVSHTRTRSMDEESEAGLSGDPAANLPPATLCVCLEATEARITVSKEKILLTLAIPLFHISYKHRHMQ